MTNKLTNTWPLSLIAGSVVLSVSSFFRFWNLKSWLIFSTDQARAMLAGRNIILGDWIWLGPETSIPGFHLGPLYYYLTALGLKLSHFHPIGPGVLVAVIGVATAIVVWRVAAYWWGREVGLLAGVLFALSPLAVVQTRIPIEPSPLPILVILWLFTQVEWVKTKRRLWWYWTLFWPLLAVQLNFSAIILWVMTAFLWMWYSSWLQHRTRLLLLVSVGTGTLGLILGKFWWGTPTTMAYFWNIWQSLTLPQSILGSALLFSLAGSLVVVWLLRQLERWQAGQSVSAIPFVLLTWLGISLAAFLLKTVNGDHALGMLFLAPALLLARSSWRLLRSGGPALLSIGTVVMFLLWSGQTVGYTSQYHQSSLKVNDHLPVVAGIYWLSGGKPYNLVYRGHLDVYDAADDHYQYLLWYLAEQPVRAGRIDLAPEHRERWLVPQTVAQKADTTITIYYPWYEAQRYGKNPEEGTRIREALLQVTSATEEE